MLVRGLFSTLPPGHYGYLSVCGYHLRVHTSVCVDGLIMGRGDYVYALVSVLVTICVGPVDLSVSLCSFVCLFQ